MKTGLNGKRGLVVAIIGLAGSVFGIDAPTGLSVAQIDYTQATCNIDCSARLSWTAPAVGENYLYTVTAVDAGGESAESAPVSFRKVENVMLGSKGYGSWNSYTDLESKGPGILNDASTSTGRSDINGGGAMTYTFAAECRSKLVCARICPLMV